MSTPVLWHFPISHFAEKARWALDWKGVAHRRWDPGPAYVVLAPLRTGRAKIPVLILDGKAIGDSSAIIAELERRWPEPPLYPEDPEQRGKALELEELFDEELGHPLRTLALHAPLDRDPDYMVRIFGMGGAPGSGLLRAVYPAFRAFYRMRHGIHPDTIADARRRAAAALDRLEAEIGPEGYLVGDRFSVADLTAAALLSPIALPPEHPYPPPPYPKSFAEEASVFAGRTALDWTRDVYRRHRGSSAEVTS